jgi:C4-dicarboxylate-specific signal transduction histidine kinase
MASGLVAFVLAAKIVAPVIRLAQGTQAIADGDLDRRVDERAPGEIADLAIAFNCMAASLKKSGSDLRDAESQLVHSAKLASLGTLSAGVAHELNQPVAIIRGLSQQLQDEPGLPSEVVADLHVIEGQTSRMSKIIKHLRTFSRVGGHESASVDINQTIRDCFILIDAQMKAHNIGIDLQFCRDEPHVMGDANELEQVFINIVTNARDALEERDNACLTIQSSVDAGVVVIRFADNGPGIPTDILPHIFDPFFTTKEAGKGTGLGLSISHSIVEKHHGEITVANDGGAVFTMRLPLAEEDTHITALLPMAA